MIATRKRLDTPLCCGNGKAGSAFASPVRQRRRFASCPLVSLTLLTNFYSLRSLRIARDLWAWIFWCRNAPSKTARHVKPMAEPLAEERQFFSEHQAEWKVAHPGKFVLVKGKQLIGTFNRPEDAVAEGARLFGTESFLVRNVDQVEQDIYIPALALGILNAGSAHSV